jgi:hypothetical protein
MSCGGPEVVRRWPGGAYPSLVLVPAGVTMIATTWSSRRWIGASRPLESV